MATGKCKQCGKGYRSRKHLEGCRGLNRLQRRAVRGSSSRTTRSSWAGIRSTFATGSGDGGYGQLAPAPAAAGINTGFYDAPAAVVSGGGVWHEQQRLQGTAKTRLACIGVGARDRRRGHRHREVDMNWRNLCLDAATLLNMRAQWTQAAHARDASGGAVPATSVHARMWSIDGALIHLGGLGMATATAMQRFRAHYGVQPREYNDDPKRKHAEVVGALRELAHCEVDEGRPVVAVVPDPDPNTGAVTFTEAERRYLSEFVRAQRQRAQEAIL